MKVQDQKLTQAEYLCAQRGLKMPEVFSQQFRIEKEGGRPLPGFTRHKLNQWAVDTGAELHCAVADLEEHGTRVALFGVAVDLNGDVVTPQHLSRQTSADTLITYLNACAGRFAFVVVTAQFSRLYIDAVGSLGAVYDQQEGSVASTINLLLTRDLIDNDDYPFTAIAASGVGKFAFGHTADKYVKRLIPNHYLDLDTLSQHRFWDGSDDVKEISPNEEAGVVEHIKNRLTQVITALTTHFPDTKLSISGGLDSRMLLACAKPVVDQLLLYSHAENMVSRKDTRIAGKLAEILGQPITVFDPLRDPQYTIDDDAQLMGLSDAHVIANGEGKPGQLVKKVRLEVLEAVPRGGLVMRGNVGELLRAMLWRRAISEYKENKAHNIQYGLRIMMLADRESFDNVAPAEKNILAQTYADWLSAFGGVAAKRPFDMLYIEQFLPHGPGNGFYGFSRNFYIFPFADRRLLSLVASLPPDRRRELRYTEALISASAPELRRMKYTRQSDTLHLRSKRNQDPNWFLAEE
ncbi:MAG: hypothetical protein AAFN63_12075 [Pseudomonadota bacterium]